MIEFIILFWVLCSILVYGFQFAMWQKEFPSLAKEDYKSDKLRSLVISIGGPIILIIMLIEYDCKYGLKYR